MNNNLTYTPLGGAGRVTSNMHVYEIDNEILIVDCGLGFADETMLGVDLLIPDITYLKNTKKKIVGMAISHGHEDHFGALPFVLPDLPSFPIFATPLTAEFANSKLKEFGLSNRVQKIDFDGGEVKIGSFTLNFIRVTHSVPDTSHIFIKTPIGNFYHGSDYKFEQTPFDGKISDLSKISELSKQGVICLLSDSLNAEKKGHIPSESIILPALEREIEKTPGKFIVTTYSSNIARVAQIVEASKKFGRKICFVGRSMINTKEMAVNLGYLRMEKGMEISLEQLKNYKDSNIVMVVAGSQGQEHSALSRIVNGDHRDIKLNPSDTVVFSSDAIPGNEISVNSLIDNIARRGARAIYSKISDDFHVSGHGAQEEIGLLMDLVKPTNAIPIGGTYKQMVQYKEVAKKHGIIDKNIILVENGQQVIFTKEGKTLGKKINLKNVYVDQISGEEVESFVLRDRQKLALDGIIIVMAEIDSSSGQLVDKPNIIVRGFSVQESRDIGINLAKQLRNSLSQKKNPVTDWIYMRKFISEVSEKFISKSFRKHPLILPVVIEV
ncbi:MAG TPA: ribonuclease J [Candidatus Sulfotelmatobacter sp.]|nr:ribonuclease J [Candidatus Sulfotelmatobacter sp.]